MYVILFDLTDKIMSILYSLAFNILYVVSTFKIVFSVMLHFKIKKRQFHSEPLVNSFLLFLDVLVSMLRPLRVSHPVHKALIFSKYSNCNLINKIQSYLVYSCLKIQNHNFIF